MTWTPPPGHWSRQAEGQQDALYLAHQRTLRASPGPSPVPPSAARATGQPGAPGGRCLPDAAKWSLRADLVLGFDPGPPEGQLGWALLQLGSPGQRLAWVDGGRHPCRSVAELLAYAPATVAIEAPDGYVWHYERGAALLATATTAGYLQGLCEARHLRHVSPSAQAWRRLVTGKASATDEIVAAAIRVHIADLPARTSVHARDAAGVALAVAWGWRPPARQTRLPLSYPRRTP